jgi:hypothetical protein
MVGSVQLIDLEGWTQVWVTSEGAKMVNPYGSIQGVLILTNQNLYFHPDWSIPVKEQFKGGEPYMWKDKKWR